MAKGAANGSELSPRSQLLGVGVRAEASVQASSRGGSKGFSPRKQLRKLHDLSKRSFVPAFYIAYVYVGLGDADQAFNWLDKACQEHSGYLVDLKEDPSFDRIRADPRFAKLLQRLNFTP